MSQDNAKDVKNYRCAHVKNETVDGVLAAFYQEHAETEDSKADTQIWISKSQGLVIKSIVSTDDATMTTRYVYKDIQAPAQASVTDR